MRERFKPVSLSVKEWHSRICFAELAMLESPRG